MANIFLLSSLVVLLFSVSIGLFLANHMTTSQNGIKDDRGLSEFDKSINHKIHTGLGSLGSQHIHADWKIYIDGKALDEIFFEPLARDTQLTTTPITSGFIHIEHAGAPPEKLGDILHVHATGVPLSMFFDSINLTLPESVRMFVNGKELENWRNYVFNDLDKILITDDSGNLTEQLNSVTGFAKLH